MPNYSYSQVSGTIDAGLEAKSLKQDEVMMLSWSCEAILGLALNTTQLSNFPES